jgi:carboxylate-amine ligase
VRVNVRRAGITEVRVYDNFGKSQPYSLGIEEEYQILDAQSLGLVSRIEALLSAVEGEAVEPRIKPELLQSVVEASTRISSTVADAVEDLTDLRDRLRRVAADESSLIASAGTHPFSRYEHQEPTERPRYIELVEQLGWLAARQLVFGLHVHVGVNSAEKAIACANGIRPHLPELLALSANSPFWQGRATGLASTRAKILDGLPRSGLPPVLASFEDFERFVDQGVRAGCFPDYTHIWWDVRPHPLLGTVEIRICDAQTRIESVAAIVALVQSLVAVIGSAFECDKTLPAIPEVVLEENKWRAARDGLQAQLIDAAGDTERPASEALTALVERCEPAAQALGCAEELGLVETVVSRGTGADDQRRNHEEAGDLSMVAQLLAWETASQPVAVR